MGEGSGLIWVDGIDLWTARKVISGGAEMFKKSKIIC
jgi:predicted small integral membrane protein